MAAIMTLLCVASISSRLMVSPAQITHADSLRQYPTARLHGFERPVSYNGYLLTTKWAKTACLKETCNQGLALPNNFFNLHGLWPECRGSKSCPFFCYQSSLHLTDLSSSTISLLNTYWNTLYSLQSEFISHEWKKHGTCMNFAKVNLAKVNPKFKALVQNGIQAYNESNDIRRQESYIQMAIALSQVYNVYEALASQGITPGDELLERDKVINVIKTYFKVSKISLSCVKAKDGSQNISEIGICLDNEFNPTSCFEDETECPPTFYYKKWTSK